MANIEIESKAPALRITIDDTYHRAKRAALAFSSLLAVAAIATTDPQFSGFQVHLPMVRLSLWLAAGYHVWLFHYEFKAMVRLNSQFVMSSPTADYTGAMSNVEATLRSAEQEIMQAVAHLARPSPPVEGAGVPPLYEEQLSLVIAEHRKRLSDIAPEKLDSETRSRFSAKLDELEKTASDLRLANNQIINQHRSAYEQTYALQTELIQGGAKRITEASDAIKQLVKDINSLGDAVASEQRIIADRFDRLAVNGLFIAASFAALGLPWVLDLCLLPWNLLCLS